MTKSSNSSKPNLKTLYEELRDAEPNAPISAQQATVLIASLINLQNVVVSVMDTMDQNTKTMNESHAATNENFIGLLGICQMLGRELNVEINGINEATTGSPYNSKTRH